MQHVTVETGGEQEYHLHIEDVTVHDTGALFLKREGEAYVYAPGVWQRVKVRAV